LHFTWNGLLADKKKAQFHRRHTYHHKAYYLNYAKTDNELDLIEYNAWMAVEMGNKIHKSIARRQQKERYREELYIICNQRKNKTADTAENNSDLIEIQLDVR